MFAGKYAVLQLTMSPNIILQRVVSIIFLRYVVWLQLLKVSLFSGMAYVRGLISRTDQEQVAGWPSTSNDSDDDDDDFFAHKKRHSSGQVQLEQYLSNDSACRQSGCMACTGLWRQSGCVACTGLCRQSGCVACTGLCRLLNLSSVPSY